MVTPQDIVAIFTDYFQNLFASQLTNAGDTQHHSRHVTIADEYTMSTPDDQEIIGLINGLNVAFYMAAWDWIKGDIIELITEFYNTGYLHLELKSTCIVLIPKKNNPDIPQDFRPINLCNVIYKIIAKSLAERLKDHLPDYIHASQNAFIKGRRITTNIILAQEIVHSFRVSSCKHKGFMLKIDLAKAFDRIEWSFIVQALRRQGFHGLINLIYNCIAAPTFSVLINGQTSGRFRSQRGIRQGCLLSPYLFVLAINELSIRLQHALKTILSQVSHSDQTAHNYIPSFLLMTSLYAAKLTCRKLI